MQDNKLCYSGIHKLGQSFVSVCLFFSIPWALLVTKHGGMWACVRACDVSVRWFSHLPMLCVYLTGPCSLISLHCLPQPLWASPGTLSGLLTLASFQILRHHKPFPNLRASCWFLSSPTFRSDLKCHLIREWQPPASQRQSAPVVLTFSEWWGPIHFFQRTVSTEHALSLSVKGWWFQVPSPQDAQMSESQINAYIMFAYNLYLSSWTLNHL